MTEGNLRSLPLVHFGVSPLFSPEGDRQILPLEKNTLTSLTHGILVLREKLGVKTDNIKKAYGNIKQMIMSEFGMEDLEQQRVSGPIPDNQLKNNQKSFFNAITALAKNLNIKKQEVPLNTRFFDLAAHSNTFRWESKVPKNEIEANSDLKRLVDAFNIDYSSHYSPANRIDIPMDYVRDKVLMSTEMQLFRTTLRELRTEARTYGLAKRVFSNVENDKALETSLKNFFFAYSSLEALLLAGDPRLGNGLSVKPK